MTSGPWRVRKRRRFKSRISTTVLLGKIHPILVTSTKDTYCSRYLLELGGFFRCAAMEDVPNVVKMRPQRLAIRQSA